SDEGEVIYSAMTCPSCFPASLVELDDINSDNVDVSWTSVNPAGTSVTVYVGLPGFDPMVDPVASENIVITGPGVQGPVNITGLSPITNYEVIILEDCSGDPADGSAPVAFVTPIANDDCSDVTPVQLVVPDVLNFTGSSVGATDNSVNQTYGAGQAWEVIELIGCAQTVTLEYCGTTPTMSTAFTGISTGCPAGFPDNYLQGTSWEWTSCGDGNPTIVFTELPAGIYYLPI